MWSKSSRGLLHRLTNELVICGFRSSVASVHANPDNPFFYRIQAVSPLRSTASGKLASFLRRIFCG